MSKSVVRCRCGHQILAKEVLRTDLYERSSGRDYVYIKFRCARCKRLGQIFIAENKWDWSVLDPSRNELSDAERDRFLDETPISSLECINFRQQLAEVFSLAQLQNLAAPAPAPANIVKAEDTPQPPAAFDQADAHAADAVDHELQDRQSKETKEREAREREVKEHRSLRGIGERGAPERNSSERGEDKNAVNKPGFKAPGSQGSDCADDAPSKP